MHPHLRQILARTPRKHVVIVATERGRPFSAMGFANFMREAIKAAGLPLSCRVHGLRKSACVRLAEAGCSAPGIASISGHRTLTEVQRYCRDAEQKKLARAAILKLEQARNVSFPNPSQPGANHKDNKGQ
jgi:site-specific recombinase XerD